MRVDTPSGIAEVGPIAASYGNFAGRLSPDNGNGRIPDFPEQCVGKDGL